jgi:hypothetical protein
MVNIFHVEKEACEEKKNIHFKQLLKQQKQAKLIRLGWKPKEKYVSNL